MLDIIAAWMDEWRTKLSLPKTNYLLITGADKSKHELQLTYQDHPFQRDPNPVLLARYHPRQGLELRETRPATTKKT
eukprot:Pgem_evm1s3367